MEVITKKDPAAWYTSQTCEGCHSIIRINANDLQAEIVDDWDNGGTHTSFWVKCPVCNWDSGVEGWDKFPKMVLQPAIERFNASNVVAILMPTPEKRSVFDWIVPLVVAVIAIGIISFIFWHHL